MSKSKATKKMECERVFEHGRGRWQQMEIDELIELIDAADTMGYITEEMEKARRHARREKCSELTTAFDQSGSEHAVALAAARIGNLYALWGFHEDPTTSDLLNARNKFGQSCAHVAIMNKQPTVLQELHRMGKSDLFEVHDGEGMTVVHHAVAHNDVQTLEFLGEQKVSLETKDKYGRTPLHIAAQCGHVHLIDVFTRRGTDFALRTNRGKTVAHFATKFGHMEFLQSLIQLKVDLNTLDNDGRGLVAEASKNNQPDILRFLVNVGLKCRVKDNDQLSPAHWAASEGHPGVIEVLHEVDGAECLSMCDRRGKTPLHVAAESGHDDVILAFKKFGFDTKVYDLSRNSPSHLAAQNGHLSALKVLAEMGPLDEKNKSGKTPAHCAAWRGNAKCVGFLAVKGADVLTCRDNDGKLPIDLAAEDDHKETIVALQWISDKLRSMAKN